MKSLTGRILGIFCVVFVAAALLTAAFKFTGIQSFGYINTQAQRMAAGNPPPSGLFFDLLSEYVRGTTPNAAAADGRVLWLLSLISVSVLLPALFAIAYFAVVGAVCPRHTNFVPHSRFVWMISAVLGIGIGWFLTFVLVSEPLVELSVPVQVLYWFIPAVIYWLCTAVFSPVAFKYTPPAARSVRNYVENLLLRKAGKN